MPTRIPHRETKLTRACTRARIASFERKGGKFNKFLLHSEVKTMTLDLQTADNDILINLPFYFKNDMLSRDLVCSYFQE